MKKYIKSAVDVHNIKQMPDDLEIEIVEKYFTNMFGVNGDTSSRGYWNDTYAAIRGNDIILAYMNDPIYYSICKNCAKYVDEFFSTNSNEEFQAFKDSHPDVTIEDTRDVYDIFYGYPV